MHSCAKCDLKAKKTEALKQHLDSELCDVKFWYLDGYLHFIPRHGNNKIRQESIKQEIIVNSIDSCQLVTPCSLCTVLVSETNLFRSRLKFTSGLLLPFVRVPGMFKYQGWYQNFGLKDLSPISRYLDVFGTFENMRSIVCVLN